MKIFLTGGTGFLGGEILILLSKDPRVEKIFCLVRAEHEEEAIDRLKKQFALHNNFFPKDKIFPVIGNLIDRTLSQKLSTNSALDDVDTVIHCAADTHFRSTKSMEFINVDGVKSVAGWASNLPNLRTFMYVGTAYICGKGVTGRTVYEDESPNPNVEHTVKYTKTKLNGEIAVRSIIPKEKLLVVRPSSVMGDSRDLKPRDFAILWVFIAINELRLVPVRGDDRIDLLGADYTAEAMLKLLFAQRRYDTYHISSGERSISTFEQIGKLIASLEEEKRPDFLFVSRENMSRIKMIMRAISKGEIIQDEEYDEYITYWRNRFGNSRTARIILSCLDDYLKFVDQDIALDNTRLLEDTGLNDPVPAYKYMELNWPHMKKIDVMQWALDS